MNTNNKLTYLTLKLMEQAELKRIQRMMKSDNVNSDVIKKLLQDFNKRFCKTPKQSNFLH